MVGTVEEALVAKQRRDEDPLSDMDKAIIGDTCRLEIPFRDKIRLRQTADLLRGYADTIDFYTRREDLPERTILFALRDEARILNRKIRETRGRGRPRKGEL